MMFEAASLALKQHGDEAIQAMEEYERHLERGGKPIGKWDDGEKLWEQDDMDRLELLAVETALDELRAATTILIYHHWERTIPNRNQTWNRNQTELITDAERSNISVSSEIGALHCAANYLKHGNLRWLAKLKEQHASKFATTTQLAEHEPWHRWLRIEDEHIHWFLEIASESNRPIVELP